MWTRLLVLIFPVASSLTVSAPPTFTMNLIGKLIFETASNWFGQRLLHAVGIGPSVAAPLLTMRHAPQQGFFLAGYAWFTWLCTRAFYGLSAMKFWNLIDTAVENSKTMYKEATKGTANNRCVGDLSGAHRALCDSYDAVLSRWYPDNVRREFMGLVPSCLFAECADIWKDMANSSMAWVVWVLVILICVVWFIQFAQWLVRMMTNVTTHASIVAVNQDQDYYHSHLSPSIRQVVDEPLRINGYATARRPALLAHSEEPAGVHQRRRSE